LACDCEEYGLVRSLYEESLTIKRRLNRLAGIAPTLERLGQLAEIEGNLVEALRLYEESYHVYERLYPGDAQWSDLCRFTSARAAGIEMNILVEYQAFFQASACRFADHYLAHVQDHILDLPALDEEVNNLFRALATYRSLQAWHDIAQFVRALDVFLDTRGYWAELRFWLEQTVDHIEAIDDPIARLDILLNLAGITSSQGDRSKAEELYHRIIQLAEQVDYRNCLGTAYYGLYTVYLNQGRSDEARECLEQVLTLDQQDGDQTLENIGRCFLEATDLSEGATEASPRVLSLAGQLTRELGPSGEVFTSSMRAWLHVMLGKYGRGRQLYQKVLKRLRQEGDAQGTAFVLYQLGLIAALEDDLTSALNYLLESEAIARKMDDCTGLILLCPSIGLVYMRQGRFNLALPYLEQSITLARQSGDEGQVAENLYWLGYAVANTGDPEQAEQIFGKSLAIFTQLGSPEAQKVRDVLSQLRQVMSQGYG